MKNNMFWSIFYFSEIAKKYDELPSWQIYQVLDLPNIGVF